MTYVEDLQVKFIWPLHHWSSSFLQLILLELIGRNYSKSKQAA